MAKGFSKVNFNYMAILLSSALILIYVSLAWSGYYAYSSYQKLKADSSRDNRITALRIMILDFDKALTQSAKMASRNGDNKWQQRYLQFKPLLKNAIDEAIFLVPEAYKGDAALKTDAANKALVDIEFQSFAHVEQGRLEQARVLLYSEEYLKQKKIYSDGMRKFGEVSGYLVDVERKKALGHLEFYAWIFVTFVFMMSLIWALIIQSIKAWRRELLTKNEQLYLTTEELQQHRDHLEESIKKRTKELSEANEQLKYLSETDSLTGISNRRYYDERLKREVIAAKRTELVLSLIIIDIDFFKKYNDLYGHSVGDTALKKIAFGIQQSVPRQSDLVARFGGEEFVVLLPATDLEGAKEVAQNIQSNIRGLNILANHSELSHIVTVSMGVASLSGDFLSEDNLFCHADRSLYQAKSQGRDRIVSSHIESHEGLGQWGV